MKNLAALWGFLGVFTLLSCAIWRLTPRALEAFQVPLETKHWVFLAVFLFFMLYSEGYRGFQKRFSPRTAARIRHLRDHSNRLHAILAPAFCMGYFHAQRRTQITAICLTLTIIALVIFVRYLPDPWHGLVDTGVVIGLLYGIVTYVYYTVVAVRSEHFPFSPEVPDGCEAATKSQL